MDEYKWGVMLKSFLRYYKQENLNVIISQEIIRNKSLLNIYVQKSLHYLL